MQLKKVLLAVSIFAVVLLVALSYILGKSDNRAEIMRNRLELEQLRASRDSIKTVVAFKDTLQKMLQQQVHMLQSEANTLRSQVDLIEQQRAQSQLVVRQLRRPEDLEKKLRTTFPELADSDWGVTEVYNAANQISIQYLLIPLWFSETFIIQNQNSTAYREQRDKLRLADSLGLRVSFLQDSLLVLEAQKGAAWKSGYDVAFAKYELVNAKYDSLLKRPPQFKIGVPNKWVFVSGALLGGAGGVLLGK
ncbi:hypothetical protein HUU05_20125 [candidate division KSB1 bacterium]|nr:hypothetical protein [candidate division KSB1 bacterium]